MSIGGSWKGLLYLGLHRPVVVRLLHDIRNRPSYRATGFQKLGLGTDVPRKFVLFSTTHKLEAGRRTRLTFYPISSSIFNHRGSIAQPWLRVPRLTIRQEHQ